jgi:hypothetical protein
VELERRQVSMGFVLDPTLAPVADSGDPGPDVDTLKGKRVGFRRDILWRSWDWVSDEWGRLAEADGAEVRFWRAKGRTGDEGDAMLKELDEFVAGVDVAVVGLANCGSCTSWTIHDALRAASTGIPTAAVCTDHFKDLAGTLARRGGRSALRRHILPYPLDTLPEAEVRDIARAHYRSFLRTLGL